MQLVIYFGGSSETDTEWMAFCRDYNYSENDALLIIAGSKHREVCNSFLFPDLKGFAKRFTKSVFRLNKNSELFINSTNQLKAKVGILGSNIDRDTKLTSITLCGASRGGVTCFEVAKELNKLAPNLPVDIIADEPVPGNLYQIPGTNAANIADCRDLKNIRSVSVVLLSQLLAT
jgi:hypothetical protein